MAKTKHIEMLRGGVTSWNEWRIKHFNILPDLRNTDMKLADLRGANLSRANLSGADLSRTNLSGANLTQANLSRAILRRANLSGANLLGGNLKGADFHGAILALTVLADIDLSAVHGLETVKHLAPSMIGIDTIYRSKGNIPSAFLRGANVPKIFISFLNSFTGKPPQFFSCLIT